MADREAEAVRRFLRETGVRAPRADRESLARLGAAFARIPYENLTKIIRAAREADRGRLFRRAPIVLEEYFEHGAGGTCFSLTDALRSILRASGFRPRVHLADRSAGENTHCAIVVPLEEGDYLLDPGFLIPAPVPLPGPGGTSRLERSDTLVWRGVASGEPIECRSGGEEGRLRYRLHPDPATEERFEQAWMASFDFSMMHTFVLSQATADGYRYLHDGYFRVQGRGAREHGEVRRPTSEVIQETFGLSPELIREAEEVLCSSRPRSGTGPSKGG